jgi:tetratricopeptide (TPR) repeat protein
MSTLFLLLISGLILLAAIVLFAGIFLDGGPSPRQIKNEQQQLSDITDRNELIEMAEKYERHEQWEPAINTWDRYLELEPEAHEVRFRRGVSRRKAGQNERAIDDFQTVVEEVEDPPAQVHLYLARAHRDLESETSALAAYRDYLDEHPEDRSVAHEAADLAVSLDKMTAARDIYETMRELDDPELYVEATLSLIRLDLDESHVERAESHFEELEGPKEDGYFTDQQHWEYLYQRARYHETAGDQSEADELYRKIYRDNPEYRDVTEIVEERIRNMSEDQLIKKMLSMDRDEFVRYCEDIVELMGYEVMSSDSFNPDEVEISAREKANMMKVNRVLFAFKKWDNQAGQMPLKEFELKMLENRYDRGFFVCPGGFNHKAKDYQDDSQDLELVGPERLLNYIREAEKQHL